MMELDDVTTSSDVFSSLPINKNHHITEFNSNRAYNFIKQHGCTQLFLAFTYN
jgi:hypothetical protein